MNEGEKRFFAGAKRFKEWFAKIPGMNDPTDAPRCTCLCDERGLQSWCPIHGDTALPQAAVDDMLKSVGGIAMTKPPDERCEVCNHIAPCGREHPGPYNPEQVDEIERELYTLIMDDRIAVFGFEGRYVARRLIATIRTRDREIERLKKGVRYIGSIAYMVRYAADPTLEVIGEQVRELTGEKAP